MDVLPAEFALFQYNSKGDPGSLLLNFCLFLFSFCHLTFFSQQGQLFPARTISPNQGLTGYRHKNPFISYLSLFAYADSRRP